MTGLSPVALSSNVELGRDPSMLTQLFVFRFCGRVTSSWDPVPKGEPATKMDGGGPRKHVSVEAHSGCSHNGRLWNDRCWRVAAVQIIDGFGMSAPGGRTEVGFRRRQVR
jgi:hypothetical protein